MTLTNKKGIALLAAIMLSFIFLALGLALMLSVKGTLRQAETGRNNLIAYNLAEAGIADALFRLNYAPEAGNFPFVANPTNLLVPSTNFIDNYTFEVPNPNDLPPRRVIRDEAIYTPYNGTTGDYYIVRAEEIPPTGSNHWKLISEGFYKGAYKKIEVRLRGQIVEEDRQTGNSGNQGIAEAFNKHVIYADVVSGINTKVKGNIAYKTSSDDPPTTDPDYLWTKTQIDPSLFDVPVPADPGVGFTAPTPTKIFRDEDAANPGYQNSTVGYVLDIEFPSYNAAIEYDDTNYNIIGTYTAPEEIWQFEGPTQVNVNANTNNTISTTGNITVSTGITVNPSTTTPPTDTALHAGGNIEINGGTINGVVACNGTLTVKNGATVTVDAFGKNLPAALFSASSIDIQNGADLTIITGANQKAAVMAYNSGAVTVNINADFNPTYTSTNQAAIIAYSSGGTATIDINADVGNGATSAGRLIYAFGTPGTINLNNGSGVVVQGCLVTNGTVNLNGDADDYLIYDLTSFKGASISEDIFADFSGGRRVYLPVIGGWK